ncbi:MAG: hypothetical protein AUG89_08470 [Acidobacteria bacterium 13_1_20CM_4_56_7]|nr:MAG: hypothetical protein AUG89_08470 [Acidobacteria bacterium 13_1_20CM_4_56_7]PYV50919.1 MAG: hypothetical protein DMG92_06085 [Acidobacteriota bacterium]
MPDNLYLNLWYSDSELVETFAHAAAVMQQLPFSPQQPGIIGVAVHPISWGEATILEEHFRPGISPEEAVTIAAGLPHEDYAYVFEASWDLWSPITPQADWTLRPSLVRFIVRGDEFEDAESGTQGQLQVDFGLDSPFLYEELQLSPEVESRVRSNVQKLVDFTTKVEKNSGAKTRLLWSESEENLAQKLVSRLQRVN